jgi:Icc-related predicted phosphoesterase
MLVPIIHQRDGTYYCEFFGEKLIAKNEEDLRNVQKRILTIGAYATVLSPDEYNDLKQDPRALDALFNRLMRERLVRWISLAEERLKGTDVVCYITGGNDDAQETVDLIKDTEHVRNPDNKVARIGEVLEMASLGWSNVTPWKTPRECTEEELSERIADLTSEITDMDNAVFNFHAPPKDSGLDAAPELDVSVYPPKPVIRGGRIMTSGAGSRAVREAIEKYQPLLGLHGHIHESKAAKKIGRTLCLNPGSEYAEAVLRGAIVNISEGKLQYQFVYG